MEKTRAGKHLKILLTTSWKSCIWFSEIGFGNSVIWDQYLPKTMNWKLGIFQLKELKQLKDISFSMKG